MSSIIAKKNLEAELSFLEDLFYENLPIGDNVDAVKQYFSCLKKLIYAKDGEIEREEFPPDDPAICGEREYRYYSSDKFKELASRHNDTTLGSNLGHSESKQKDIHAKQDTSANTQDLEHVQEHPLFGGTFDADQEHHHLRGELDSRDSREFFDESIN
jgi:hypothetical protein